LEYVARLLSYFEYNVLAGNSNNINNIINIIIMIKEQDISESTIDKKSTYSIPLLYMIQTLINNEWTLYNRNPIFR